jgi:hypothetical protein
MPSIGENGAFIRALGYVCRLLLTTFAPLLNVKIDG